MLAIASHHCIDRLRRRRFALVPWDDLFPCIWLSDPQPGPEEVTLSHEAQRHAQRLLVTLPPDYRTAVTLRYWHELSYKEIAETLSSTVPAIKLRLFRARQMMAQAAVQAEARLAPSNPVLVNGIEALR